MTLPRRGPLTPEERLANAVRSQPVNTADGGIITRKANRRTPTAPLASTGDLAIATRDRMTIEWFSDDVLSEEGEIALSWASSTYDSAGDSIQFGSGRFHLFGEGIYCVTIRVIASSIDVATSDMVVAAAAGIWDRPDPESIAAITRGQTPSTNDTGSMIASTTFYSEGQGLASDGIQIFVRTNNLVTSGDAGRVYVMVAIQKIVAFA